MSDPKSGRIGFTGSQHGIRYPAQREALLMTLAKFRVRGARWMHNGDCRGSDAIAGRVWRQLDGLLWLHPPTKEDKRAFLTCDFASDPLPYLDRNHVIVNLCEELVATPAEMFEQQRSGTWATIRYAAKMRRPTTIIWPNGSVERREHCDRDTSLAEDAKRLSPEGVAARAEGIAQPPPIDHDYRIDTLDLSTQQPDLHNGASDKQNADPASATAHALANDGEHIPVEDKP